MSVRTSSRRRLGRPTAVATEVLLLRPRGVTGPPATVGESSIWPMFVMVVTEPADPAAGLALPLFDLLHRREYANEPSIVAVETAWSVLDSTNALLTLTVRAAEPVSVDLTILLPAAPVLDILHVIARGATVGVTTQERADRLRGGVDVQTALRDVVMLSCLPSAELNDLVAVLRDTRES
jgi:hypothetical protein